MKKIICLCLTMLFFSGVTVRSQIQEKPETFEQAKKLSAELNKPILIEFVRTD